MLDSIILSAFIVSLSLFSFIMATDSKYLYTFDTNKMKNIYKAVGIWRR